MKVPVGFSAAILLIVAFGCSRSAEETAADRPRDADASAVVQSAEATADEVIPITSQDNLCVLISATSLKAAEKPFSMGLSDIPLSRLADTDTWSGGGTGSVGGGMIIACGLDNEGRWHCTTTTYESEPTNAEGSYGVSRKDATTLEVDAEIEVDGKKYEASGELKIELGRCTVLHLPPDGEHKYRFTFEIAPRQVE